MSIRQAEVAELVALGLTDQEIGQRLFLSRRTVEGHLQEIRNRLGFANRTQIAAWVAGQQVAAEAPPPDTEPAEPPVPPDTLPRYLTRFVGRERELAEARRLLQSVTLLTITGPGGCGKTRFAVEAAAGLLRRYPAGVWFVDLSSVTDPDVVPREVAAALRIREREGADPLDVIREALVARTRRRQVLVILDNCEHLLSRCAATVGALMRACADLTFLCTSREPLHLTGETIWSLGPLPVPADDVPASPATIEGSEAIRLFLDRVRYGDPGFQLDERSAPGVLRLCRWLDGMPLALELAAARVRLMSFDHILMHLEERVSSPVAHGAAGRQRTMTATIEWSYDLLSDDERRLLRRLSVFRGGFTLDAAGTVCGEPDETAGTTLELLTLLADKSLIWPVPPERDRYRCLELVRRFMWQRLEASGELETVQGRHFEHFSVFVKTAGPNLTGPAQSTWIDRLSQDHDNVRAALQTSRQHEVEGRLELTLGLHRFWAIRCYLGEGRDWMEEVLRDSAGDEPTPLRARVLNAAAGLVWRQGDLGRALEWLEESLAASRALEDRSGVQFCLGNLGLVSAWRGDFPKARSCYAESLALARDLGEEREAAVVLCNLGVLTAYLGNDQVARDHLDESLRIMHALGDSTGSAATLADMGMAALYRGADVEAAELYVRSLRLLSSVGARQSLAECLEGLASVAARVGALERALRLAAAASGIRELTGAAAAPWSRRLLEEWLSPARDELGEAAARAWEEGLELSTSEAVALALAAPAA